MSELYNEIVARWEVIDNQGETWTKEHIYDTFRHIFPDLDREELYVPRGEGMISLSVFDDRVYLDKILYHKEGWEDINLDIDVGLLTETFKEMENFISSITSMVTLGTFKIKVLNYCSGGCSGSSEVE